MKRIEFWKLSVLNVFASPVKSLLTVLGFAVGVAAVLAVVTLGDAGKMQVQNEMTRLGIDRIWVQPVAGDGMQRGTERWLSQNTGMQTCELIYFPTAVSSMDGKNDQATAVGCARHYLAGVAISEGRTPLFPEWNQKATVVLIGEELAEKLAVGCGDFVMIAQKAYEVCGILSAGNTVESVPMENAVVMPADILAGFTGDSIHELRLTAGENMSVENAEKLAVQMLQNQGKRVRTVTMAVQMEAASNVIGTFVSVLGWVAFVCVLTGGIGIMNILLVSIRERRREIGVMKSMGTTSSQICALFLLEALMYAVIGGVLGILLGIGLIDAAGRSIDLPANAKMQDCIALLAASCGIGAAFGVLPALRASGMRCVDALRQE